jgi:hypothetical protein
MTIENLLKLNVNEHTEKKNNLTYLSWAWAWAEVLKADPTATYKVEMFGDKCFMDINGTAMVWVNVTVFGKPMTCQLPVMDHTNTPIPLEGRIIKGKNGRPDIEVKFDSFAVNTAIMRCMTKALALHGLGLYIYAGEDLPDTGPLDQQEVAKHQQAIAESKTIEALQAAFKEAYKAAAAANDHEAIKSFTAAKDEAKKGLEK